MQSLIVLGRQPALGIAELESLYGSENLTHVGQQAVIVNVDPTNIDFDRLGGAVKFCKVLHVLDTSQWSKVEDFLLVAGPDYARSLPPGKLQFGLSVQGYNLQVRQLSTLGLKIKILIRKTGRSVRIVPNKELELNTAQVHHNKLTGPNGAEIVIINSGDNHTVIAQTIAVQDIASYTLRDRDRPKRDARVGMLPPKLAQIIINLAVGRLSANTSDSSGKIILDPFCGTGVLLQEAMLMGLTPYGTDIDDRMIDYSKQNLAWLKTKYKYASTEAKLQPADATNFTWEPPINFVAGETYLGKPFTSAPAHEALAQTISDCNLIIKKFLRNIHDQLPAGTRLCLAIPAWATKNTQNPFKMLPLVDQISDLGYNRVSFKHAGNDTLIYHRPDQYVARQLIVLTKMQ